MAAVKTHIHNISKNGYWKNLKSSLDFVVVVMSEYALLPALDRDNTLNEFAMDKHVVLVTPSTLLLLLRAVNLMWRQSQMTAAVKEMGDLARDLHERLGVFAGHYNKIGKDLNDAIKSHNAGIGSWSRRVVPAIYKLG